MSSRDNAVELSLKGDDIEHLNKFKAFLKCSKDPKLSNITCNNKKFLRCRLQVMDKHFKERLIELGCVPQKSLILTFPNVTIFKNADLIYDFIRGYVDGDGCISFTKTGNATLAIIGTLEFLTEVKNIFPNGFHNAMIKDKRCKNNTYTLRTSGEKAKFVLMKLYKNSSIYLQRKYNRFAVLSSN